MSATAVDARFVPVTVMKEPGRIVCVPSLELTTPLVPLASWGAPGEAVIGKTLRPDRVMA